MASRALLAPPTLGSQQHSKRPAAQPSDLSKEMKPVDIFGRSSFNFPDVPLSSPLSFPNFVEAKRVSDAEKSSATVVSNNFSSESTSSAVTSPGSGLGSPPEVIIATTKAPNKPARRRKQNISDRRHSLPTSIMLSPIQLSDAVTHPVPEFLCHLFSMLRDPSLSGLISWSVPFEDEPYEQGGGIKGIGKIVVHNPEGLQNDVLGKYYRHSKYASFQRQLNYFGFKKRLHGGKKGKLSPCSYVHDKLGPEPRSLFQLKRRPPANKRNSTVAEESLINAITPSESTKPSKKAKKVKQNKALVEKKLPSDAAASEISSPVTISMDIACRSNFPDTHPNVALPPNMPLMAKAESTAPPTLPRRLVQCLSASVEDENSHHDETLLPPIVSLSEQNTAPVEKDSLGSPTTTAMDIACISNFPDIHQNVVLPPNMPLMAQAESTILPSPSRRLAQRLSTPVKDKNSLHDGTFLPQIVNVSDDQNDMKAPRAKVVTNETQRSLKRASGKSKREPYIIPSSSASDVILALQVTRHPVPNPLANLGYEESDDPFCDNSCVKNQISIFPVAPLSCTQPPCEELTREMGHSPVVHLLDDDLAVPSAPCVTPRDSAAQHALENNAPSLVWDDTLSKLLSTTLPPSDELFDDGMSAGSLSEDYVFGTGLQVIDDGMFLP